MRAVETMKAVPTPRPPAVPDKCAPKDPTAKAGRSSAVKDFSPTYLTAN